MTDLDLVKVPFLVDRPYGEILDRLDDERPDEEAFEAIEDYDTAMQEWEERLYAVFFDPGFTGGAICLVHYGCAQRAWLVVSGPARGQMWWDFSCDGQDLEPMLDHLATAGAPTASSEGRRGRRPISPAAPRPVTPRNFARRQRRPSETGR
ncbi:hypothetical protein [Catellatospora citrea]|uniref:SUKH superfamily protein n=1 Tax=Catellatospora citrea TaxID=53366 RepID=A0A8J3KXJ8_9ACTN|nr:hypothetical protein [Catellatospora citrea]RKE10525.1 hypothetical protein C8E86_5432 [Catellatospora citrea]GIG03045.1 hypothetical protein Cci01nite_81380 [Catellatospora citrea]